MNIGDWRMAAPMPEPVYVRAADLVIIFDIYGTDWVCGGHMILFLNP